MLLTFKAFFHNVSFYNRLYIICTMEKLAQSHLHPPLELPETNMSRSGIKPGSPSTQASTLAKTYSNSLLIAIGNIL
jgi:hypothetical protein